MNPELENLLKSLRESEKPAKAVGMMRTLYRVMWGLLALAIAVAVFLFGVWIGNGEEEPTMPTTWEMTR